jgi:hypothetical protein
MLIPQGDLGILLNTLGKTLEAESHIPKAFVFDNISNMIMEFGFEGAYKFVKQMTDMLTRSDSAFLFLIMTDTDDEKILKVLEPPFSNVVYFDSKGLRARPSNK